MIDPRFLQAAFRMAFFILALSLVMLPFEPRDSAAFVVAVMTVIVSGTFVLAIAVIARRARSSPPNDKRNENGYTSRFRRRGP